MNEESEDTLAHEPRSAATTRLFIAGILIVIGALSLIVFTKDPGQGGPLVVLSFLLLVFLLVLLLSITMLRLLEKNLSKKFSWLRVLYTGVAIAAGVVFLIGLKTLRQLQAIDVALVVVFEFLLNFYLLRRF